MQDPAFQQPLFGAEQVIADYRDDVKNRSDKLINYFLFLFFGAGLYFAHFYDTWTIAFGVGGTTCLAYYSIKLLLPDSSLYQYVLSVCLGVFMMQFIYQMHGMYEMHFFAFIGSAILITYQKWQLQVPMFVFVFIHHLGFNQLQQMGFAVYFTELDFLELQTMLIHISLTAVIFMTCGLWSYHLNKYNVAHLSMLSDIKDRNRYQQELEQLNAQLQETNREAVLARKEAEMAAHAKSTFLATMSHEIRTPMNGVIGMASLLANTDLTAEQADYLHVIHTSGEALLNVINDVLDYSKIESGEMELEEQSFDLHSTIEDVIDLFAVKAAEVGIDLLYEINLCIPEIIIADSYRLRQILINLVNNAVKFTPKGEVFVGVKQVKPVDGKTILLFEVRDSGIGIPADKISRLFKAFSQVDSSNTRKYGGTGLGLIISERLVKLMNGDLNVESTSGVGSVFSFTIQCKVDKNALPLAQQIDETLFTGNRILIVDDNTTNLDILKKQLEFRGFKPTTASSGALALQALNGSEAFHLIITDMQMPEMDGVMLAEEIRARSIQIPIILLSSIGLEIKPHYRGKFTAVINKPAKIKQIVNLIHQSLSDAAHDDRLNRPKTIKQLEATFASKYPLDILVAEDNPINIKLISIVLAKLGYTVDIAENGDIAIRMCTQKRYDLILMDVLMPEVDGIDATKHIRNIEGFQPRIVAMTANAMQDDRSNCISAGMDDYMTKPLEFGLLKNVLMEASLHRNLNS